MADDILSLAEKLMRLPDDIRAQLRDTFSVISTKIVQRASSVHMYVSRTGRLTSSIKADYTDTGVEAYLDTGVAKYAQYVHADDPFLTNAFDTLQPQIDAEINRALDKVLSEV